MPLVGTPVIGEWSEETEYPWGCCARTRTVTVDVEVPDADPWSYVMLVGLFDLGYANQITQEEEHTRLDVQPGAGPHTLSVLQWEEDGMAQPPCFDIVAVSASGVSGPAEEVCPDGDEPGADDAIDGNATSEGCGCATSDGAPAGSLLLTLCLWRRRRALRPQTGGNP